MKDCQAFGAEYLNGWLHDITIEKPLKWLPVMPTKKRKWLALILELGDIEMGQSIKQYV